MIGYFDAYLDFKTAGGVFSMTNYSNTIPVLDRSLQGNHGIEISASKSNAIFGASDTVQPKTLRGYALIRYE